MGVNQTDKHLCQTPYQWPTYWYREAWLLLPIFTATGVAPVRVRPIGGLSTISHVPHRAAASWLDAGEGLRAVIAALGQWGMTYTHDRIKRSDLDPALLIWGLRRRVDVNALPDRRVVLRFEFSGVPASRTIMWLILGRSSVDVS